MSIIDQLRKQIIDWSNKFPLDSSFRKKHNIPFGSEEHRRINQIDVYYEWLEEELHKEFLEKAKKELQNEADFEKGIWLRESVAEGSNDIDLFNKLNVKSINDASQLSIEDE